MTLTTYPLDHTDYTAADAALFHATRSSGIYGDDDFTYSVTGSGNQITLEPGIAWLRLSRFRGCVTALKQQAVVNLGLPDQTLPRIDRVALRYDANVNNVRVVVLNGTPAASPQPPGRSTTEALFELHLLEVYRSPGAASVTASNVTDLRLDPEYCGLMSDGDGLSLSQFNAFYADKVITRNASLYSSGWSSKSQTISVPGVTSSNTVIVTAAPSGWVSYVECGVRCTGQGAGTLTFACEEKPGGNVGVNILILN